MTGRNQQKISGGRPSIGSVSIVVLLKIFGGFFGLFRGKKTYSNMSSGEQKFFSSTLDGMKPDQRGER